MATKSVIKLIQRSKIAATLLFGAAFAANAVSAGAASLVWDPGNTPATPSGGAGSWDLANTNWSKAGADVAWTDITGTADTATFGGLASGAVAFNASLGALGLIFNTPGYTISGGNTLTLGASGIDASSLTSGTTSITNAVALQSPQTWLSGPGSTLAMTGVISGASANALTLNSATSTGTIKLTAANTYSGGNTINGGRVVLGTLTSLGATGPLTVNTGGTLDLNLAVTGTQPSVSSLSGGGTILNDGIGQAVLTVRQSGASTFSGTIKDNDNAGTSTLYLDKLSAGVLTLTGANTYTGPTKVGNGGLVIGTGGSLAPVTQMIIGNGNGNTPGILQLGDAGGPINQAVTNLQSGGTSVGTAIISGNATYSTITDNQTTNTGFYGTIGGAGANQNNINVVISGTGGLSLGGTFGNVTGGTQITNSYTGSTTVNGGRLLASRGALSGNGPVVIGSIGNIYLLGGPYTLSNSSWSLAGVLQAGNGAAYTVTGPVRLTSATATLSSDGGATITLSGVVSGAQPLTASGTGTVALSGNNTYTLGTTVTNGTLQDIEPATSAAATQLGTGAVNIGTSGTLAFEGAGGALQTYTVANAINLTGGTLFSNDGQQNLNGLVTVSNPSTLLSHYINKDMYFAGGITGTANLTVDTVNPYGYGEGYIQLPVANAGYTGTVTINAPNTAGGYYGGSISVTNANALQNAAVVNNDSNAIDTTQTAVGRAPTLYGGLLFFSNLSAATIGSLAGIGSFGLGSNSAPPTAITFANPVALTTGGNNTSTTYSGVLSAAGSLTKTGTGDMTLTSSNTYTGSTTVNGGGTLELDNTASAAAITASNAFNVTGSGSVIKYDADEQIAGGPAITLTGGGTLNLNSHNQTASSLGTLTLGTGTSNIDYGQFIGSNPNVNTINFADSVATLGSGSLYILDYSSTGTPGTFNGNTKLFIGTAAADAAGGLTTTELSQITFISPSGLPAAAYSATQIFGGEIVPNVAVVPEPKGYMPFLIGAGAIAILAASRKRIRTA